MGGDFNMILTLEEKTGGTKRMEQDSGKFKALIDQLNMVDMETRMEFSLGPIEYLDTSMFLAY